MKFIATGLLGVLRQSPFVPNCARGIGSMTSGGRAKIIGTRGREGRGEAWKRERILRREGEGRARARAREV